MKFNLKKYAKDKAEDFEYNPWAVCHTTVDKDEDPAKYERCVKKVKNKTRKKKSKKASNARVLLATDLKGRSVRGMNPTRLDQFMGNWDYIFYRENYPWGKTLSYRPRQGDGEHLFVLNGELVDWDTLAEEIRQTWIPRTDEDRGWYNENIGNTP